MTRILVLNGPNLRALGRREPHVYGSSTLDDIQQAVSHRAGDLGVDIRFAQSNHEGALVDILEEEQDKSDGCIVNPGGFTHTSVTLLDALRTFAKPVIEVHLTNIYARESFRQRCVTTQAASGVIAGLGKESYVLALEGLVKLAAKGGRSEAVT